MYIYSEFSCDPTAIPGALEGRERVVGTQLGVKGPLYIVLMYCQILTFIRIFVRLKIFKKSFLLSKIVKRNRRTIVQVNGMANGCLDKWKVVVTDKKKA